MAGKKLSDVLPAHVKNKELTLPWTAVKEAVLPWTRFPGVNAILGPEMRSTGEVMGIDDQFPTAYAKSQSAANSPLPRKGKVLLSLHKGTRPRAIETVRRLHRCGFEILATEGTALAIREAGIPVEIVKKIEEGRPNVVDVVMNGEVSLIINTPSGIRSWSDGFEIRNAALRVGLPIITTIAAADAASIAIESAQKTSWSIRSLQDYYKKLNLTSTPNKKSKKKLLSLR
jgi:carbamoyl-phosphate synthase large subunit